MTYSEPYSEPRASSSNGKYALSKNLKVGVLAGGDSSERAISIRSGRAVKNALTSLGFKTSWIDPADSARLSKRIKQIDLAFIALHGKGGEDGKIQIFLEDRLI